MINKPVTYPRFFLAAVLVMIPLLPGCAAENVREADWLQSLTALERTPSSDPAALADIDILALKADGREFVESRISGIREPYEKVRALRRTVFDPDGLNYSLDDNLTLTADETFKRAGGNCVALANFFVAAVRHLGMDAVFQEIERRTATEANGLRVVERHINVSGELRWRDRRARYILDYLSVPEEDFGQAQIISDQRAFTHYYNNIAMAHLKNGGADTALQYLKKAILTDGNVDFIWSNLGVVYARRDDYEAAEFAYRRALELNPDNPSAQRNLISLKEKTGKINELSR